MILAIVPCRAGSKGIKDKNIYRLFRRKLYLWTVKEIKKSNMIDDYVITTDIQSILDNHKSHVLFRPEELGNDTAKMIDVLKHAIGFYPEADTIVLLQPTSPLRTASDVDNAIEVFENSNANCLYSGYYMGIKHKSKVYDKHTSEKHFQRNGAIFICKRSLIEQGKIWDDTAVEFEMPLSRSIDIDCMDDMMIAEALLQYRALGGQI